MFRKLTNEKINNFRPKAVLIDTDNTLYEYEPAHKFAIKVVSNKIKRLFDVSYPEFQIIYERSKLEVKLQLGNTASSHSRLLYFQRFLENIGCKVNLMLALDLEQTYWRTFLANAPLFDSVDIFLNLLKEENIPLAVVTDLTSHIQLRKLTYFNLEDTFDAVVCSEEVGLDKPNKANFELALKKLNLNESSDVWMIGDNPATDIVGGKSINAITFQKIHNGVLIGKNEEQPDFIFDNYKELISKLKINNIHK